MNSYEVRGSVPGIGTIGIVVSAQNECAAINAFKSMYPGAQVGFVKKLSGS